MKLNGKRVGKEKEENRHDKEMGNQEIHYAGRDVGHF